MIIQNELKGVKKKIPPTRPQNIDTMVHKDYMSRRLGYLKKKKVQKKEGPPVRGVEDMSPFSLPKAFFLWTYYYK